MPSYKIYYFDSAGLGEILRLMLADQGIDFEDVRFNQEDWPKYKPGEFVRYLIQCQIYDDPFSFFLGFTFW